MITTISLVIICHLILIKKIRKMFYPCMKTLRSYSQQLLNIPDSTVNYGYHVVHDISSLSVQFSCSVMSDSLPPHGLQHARLPCPSPAPRSCSNSCPLSQWCHPATSSSVVPFSFYLQPFPASGSFQKSQFFTSGGQSIGVSASASVLPVNIQDWFPLGLSGLTFLQSKGLSRVFSNTTVQKHPILQHSAFQYLLIF